MKHVLIIAVLITLLAVSDSFSQIGHGMMREHGSGQGMISHEQMMGNMTDMMKELSGLMGKMSEMMKDMPKENIHNMSGMMRDVCFEMSRMSEIMDKGTAKDEEIKAVHHRIMELKKRMTEIKR